jgi:protein-S-isoprenylcysteine O-methyltransferase Ste14
MDIMGEAKRLALFFLPALILSVIAEILFPRAFSFLGKLYGAGLAVGLELGAIGLIFWASAAARLIPALRVGRLAMRGAYGLCRHPVFAWWIYFVLPALSLGLDSWIFAALAAFLYFLARDAAIREEAALVKKFGDEYRNYAERTRRLLPVPRFRPFILRRYGKAIASLAGLGLFTLFVLIAVVQPIALTLGSSATERARSYAGDEIVPRQRQGFLQAELIHAPASVVWTWLVQVGYKRGGWYNIDAINRLAGPGYFYEGNGSAERIIPELQTLALGDSVALAPGAELKVCALETGRLLVLAGDPTGVSENNAAWTFELVPVDERSCRLISKFRSVFPGGLPAELLNGFVNVIGGAIIQQPAMFQGIRQRAEASFRQK